ncbi:MAG: Gfo/Idh/MocA family oxidoreductase [Gemmatimonadales bacterium]|nr:Gfo/Idh/MocA family oxidoreductase [Gemmatimonadales bacterium]
MTPPASLGIGIIGFGFMGRTHAAAYEAARRRGLPLTVRAVVSARGSDLDKTPPRGHGTLATVESDLPESAKRLDSVDDLLAREEIHAVSICTYTESHVDLAIAALKAGKHVLVEKPIALEQREVARLAAAARAANLTAMPAMCMRFWPGWPWLRDRIRAGTFGAVRSAQFTRMGARPDWGAAFYGDDRRSGGALFDMHVHDADFIRWCFGHPARVRSAGTRHDVTTAYFFDESPAGIGARGAWIAPGTAPFAMCFEVEFDEASASFDLSRSSPLRVDHRSEVGPIVLPKETAYEAEVRHFAEVVLGRAATAIATMEEAVAVTRMLEAEALSQETGESVALGPP